MDLRFHFRNLLFTMLFLLSQLSVGLIARQFKVVDVRKLGAIADGKTDNTQAFLNAWNRVCGLEGNNALLVPEAKGAFMLRKVTFAGPCKGHTRFYMKGTIRAFNDKSAIFGESWITFQYLNNFEMSGGGLFDGQGAAAWPYNKCSKGQCPKLPSTLVFNFVNDSIIDNIRSVDSRSGHIHIFGCSDVTFQHINLQAPDDSPNTDGIRMGSSNKIKILDSTIGTGDDCVGMLPGLLDTRIEGVRCGPGHGISVGSLGGSPNEKDVNGLIVKNCTLTGTQNGLRIKTWESPYKSKVYDITYEDIIVENVQNPIVIDQQYCPSGGCQKGQASHVSIEKVTYTNVRGTSASEAAVNLQCSSAVPCKNVILKDIIMIRNDEKHPIKSSCSSVQGASYGVQKPKACM